MNSFIHCRAFLSADIMLFYSIRKKAAVCSHKLINSCIEYLPHFLRDTQNYRVSYMDMVDFKELLPVALFLVFNMLH